MPQLPFRDLCDAPVTGAFDLVCEGLADTELAVVAFHGRERLSHPYGFRVDVLARSALGAPAVEPAALVGARACLRLGSGDRPPRRVFGVISRVERRAHGGGRADERHLRIQIVPRLALLAHGRTSRIFQDATTRDIVAKILAERGVPCSFQVLQELPRRAYSVQYKESDLAYVERILAEEGIFYFFEEIAGEEHLVLADHPGALVHPDAEIALRFRDSEGSDDEARDVRSFSTRASLATTETLLRAYDFRRPSFDARGAASAEAPRTGRFYDHDGTFESVPLDDADALRALQERRRRTLLSEGTSRARALAPRIPFALTETPDGAFDGAYAVLEVEHRGNVSELSGKPGDLYENRFVAVPEGTPVRPRRRRRRLQQVTETATVVGPDGHEIHTDPLGRIKVQMHWDLEGQRNEHSSCWMRVAQPWAGSRWGFQFIPRIGMEVLVTFLGGDVDRPVIAGALYNEGLPPPFPLPGEKTKSGIVTRSSKGGGGYNELSFEDRKGYERVHLRAERDLTEEVQRDHREKVGANATTEIGAHRVVRTAQNDLLTVGQNLFRTVGGNETALVDGALGTAVGGDASLSVGGNQIISAAGDASLRAGGSVVTTAGGDMTTAVGGHSVTTVGGSAAFSCDGSLRVSASGAGGAVVVVASDARLTVGGSLQVVAVNGIRIVCGTSMIEILEDEVKIIADKITAIAANEASLTGGSASLKLDGDLSAVGGTATLQGSGAELRLGSDAELKGGSVKLGSGGGKSASKDSSPTSDKAPPPKLEIVVHTGDEDSGSTGKLVLLNAEREVVREMDTGSAKSRSGGACTWEIDPDEHDEPVEIVWRTDQGDTHIAGPLIPREARDALVGERHREALHQLRERRSAPKNRQRPAPPPEPEHPGPSPEPTFHELFSGGDDPWLP